MNPTQEQLNARVRATGQSPAPNNSTPTIPASLLVNPSQPLDVPQYNEPVSVPFQPSFVTQQLQQQSNQSRAELGRIVDQLGQQPVRQQQIEQQAGLPDIQKRISELSAIDAQYGADLSNINSRELQQNVRGDLATNYAPLRSAISSRDTRVNIQQQQDINIKRATNAAALAAANGQLALAQDYVSRALDYEFKPLEAKLEYQKLLYQENKELFTTAEQRDYEAHIKKEEREYEQMREDKTQRMNLVTTLGSFGVSQEITNRIMDADDISQALKIAAPYMQSPESKVQIEKMYLDMQLTKEQIATARAQREQMGKPTAAEAKEINAQSNLQRTANDRANKVNSLINEIKNHPAYSTGTGVSSYVLAGNYNVRDFNKKVEQLRALLAIDAIKDFKGTGPMSDREFATAGAAATALNPTGKQSFFTDELTKIQASMNAVLDETATSLISADERGFIYSGGITNQSTLPAQSFYDN